MYKLSVTNNNYIINIYHMCWKIYELLDLVESIIKTLSKLNNFDIINLIKY